MINWNQLYIHPSDDTTDSDVRDFIEWVSRKAERLGFRVELKRQSQSGSGSSEAVSTNPLEKHNETH